MPDFTNIVTVDLTEATGYNVEAHRAVHQWDSGVILQLTGATFPQGTTCQFDTKTTTFNQELTDGACEIPNALLGYDMIGDIKAHVKIDDDDYGIVVYDIHIPVIRRPKPDSYIYTDNSSSSNGWIKSRYGYRVNEDQTILGQTELSINDNQTILNGTTLSLNNQQTVLDGTHLSLASGLFYADSTHLQLNSGRITIGPNFMKVDNRWFGSVNLIDLRKLENGGLNTSNGEDLWYTPIHVRTNYIKVDGNTLYTCSKDITNIQLRMRCVCYYDANLRFMSYIAPDADAQSYTFTTPVGTAYLRIGFQRISGGSGIDVTVDTFTWAQLEKGSTLSNLVTHSLDCVELTNRCLQDLPSGNLYDWDSYPMQQGGINSDSSGTEFNSDQRVRTDYLSCTQRTTYTFSVSKNAAVSAVRLYTAKGALSTSINNSSTSSSMTFTTPDSITYMRFIMVNITGASNNITASAVKNPTLTVGKDIKPYVPFADSIIELSAKARRLFQTYEPLIADGKTISPNVNLNTAMYCDVGRYVCPLSTTPATLVNCPTRNAFYMIVRNATKTDINTSTLTWQYLIREITDVNGNQYTQTAFCGSSAGSWVFGAWYFVNQSLASEGGNTAQWLKASVGRQSSIDFAHIYDGDKVHSRLDIVTGSLSSNPFDGDGYALTFMWDTSAEWDTQVFFPSGGGHPAYRKKQNSSWGTSIYFITGYKTGTLTANTGIFSESYCRQSGDTVNIYGWLERLSTSIQSHENAVTVSGVSLPSVPVRFVFTCWISNNIAAYAGYGVLDTTGKITFVKAVANSDKVSFTITYVV